MMNKKLLIIFLLMICFVLIVNVISFINDIPGSKYGIYLNTFNIMSILIEFKLFCILNKAIDEEK